MRLLASVLLVPLTLGTAVVPEAFAQAPVRPDPQELWRQFPLDAGRSNQQARSNQQRPAEPSSAPVSPPASRSGAEEGRDRSQTAQLAAVVLTMALVLILTTGMLAYATHGRVELRTGLRLRAWVRKTGDALRAARTDQRQQHIGRRFRRRLAFAAAPLLRRIRAVVSNLREHTASAETPRPASRRATFTETLDTATRSRESTADEELEKLKAKLDVGPAPTRTPADDQREILKAKRSERVPVDIERPDEVETLKAKLTGSAPAETTPRKVAKAKGTPKIGLADTAAEEEAPVAVYADRSSGAAAETQTRRAGDSLARTNGGR